MSLNRALAYMDRLGVFDCTVTPDPDPLFWTITLDRDVTPGARSVLLSRMRMAILEHRRALSEPASVLSESWSVKRTDTGGVLLSHRTCRLLSLPRYGTKDAA